MVNPAVSIQKKGGRQSARPLSKPDVLLGLSSCDCFDLEADLDVVSDDYPACLQGLIPGQPEIASIDLAARAEPDAFPTPGVSGPAFECNIERNWLRYVTDCQIARNLEALLVTLNPGAAELDLGILLDIQEIRRAQVLVALVGAGIETRGFEYRFDGRVLRIFLVAVDRSFDIRDAALHSRDHQMLGGEFDQGVSGIEFPGVSTTRLRGGDDFCGCGS
jgi:hypothetical protein